MSLDLHADPVDLTAALVDVFSVSGSEAELATLVQEALGKQAPHLEVVRNGDAVLARTNLGRASRVVLAGHLDTVPENGNLPSRREGEFLHGLGTVDMKGGDAVFLHLAATLPEPKHDITFVFYDNEEVEATKNGLGRIERELPEWLAGDLAIVGEPSNGVIEAGCQGTMRVELRSSGRARTPRGRGWGRTRSTRWPSRCGGWRSTAAGRRHRRADLPRGPAGVRDQRRGGRQRRPGRGGADGQPPLRPGPRRRGGRASPA